MNAADAPPEPYIFHLTKSMRRLEAILGERIVRAYQQFGAGRTRSALVPLQRCACLSELATPELRRLADQHGDFGLAFQRSFVAKAGGAPIWYLRAGTPMHERLVGLLDQMERANKSHWIWELTPFIDFPGTHPSGSGPRRYEFSWEREWRVVGGLEFTPKDVAALFAPERDHERVRELWLAEVVRNRRGKFPALVDLSWDAERQRSEFDPGAILAASDLEGAYNPYGPSSWHAVDLDAQYEVPADDWGESFERDDI